MKVTIFKSDSQNNPYHLISKLKKKNIFCCKHNSIVNWFSIIKCRIQTKKPATEEPNYIYIYIYIDTSILVLTIPLHQTRMAGHLRATECKNKRC